MAKQKKRRSTGRSTQRHRALDVLFEADEKNITSEAGILDLLAERQRVSTAQVPIGEFGSQIVTAYAQQISQVDTLIEASSEDWALDRMNAVDRSALRGAVAELMYLGTFRGAVIVEWTNLVREFSTDRSVGFVMGVLNKAADIREREESGSTPILQNDDAASAVESGEESELSESDEAGLIDAIRTGQLDTLEASDAGLAVSAANSPTQVPEDSRGESTLATDEPHA
ncbi:transcription antitermination protein NusB [Actinotignum timonense]|uniref:transcription antitermination protein NusB n=1 Tax=Actinotignum TaxID=1653174 RepID=UPI00254EFC53|nr:transcription antitermination protein NusB [Actinotignum timonense]MDK6906076.1 transcription antitermination protein NusB [Actinotignum timonense]MDK8782055.1 transcription antitermination protein NusB [Actinotignum timonense]MDY5138843.1 transcription antitermination protein NusB [Actinotignum timonense]